jgi:hypothetical protein
MKHFPGPRFRVVRTIFQKPLTLVIGVLLCFFPTAARGQSMSFAGAPSVLAAKNGILRAKRAGARAFVRTAWER